MAPKKDHKSASPKRLLRGNVKRSWPSQTSGKIPGDSRTFSALNSWLRNNGSSMSLLADEMNGHMPLDEFRKYIMEKSVASYKKYKVMLRDGLLDPRCPDVPAKKYGVPWDEILRGRRNRFSLEEARAYLEENGIRCQAEHDRFRRSGRCDPRCPPYPEIAYRTQIWERHRNFSHDELRDYLEKHGIGSASEYVKAARSGRLDPRCPSRSKLFSDGWKWPQPKTVPIQHSAAELVRIATDPYVSLHEAMRLLGVKKSVIDKVRSGRHSACREVGYTPDGRKYPRASSTGLNDSDRTRIVVEALTKYVVEHDGCRPASTLYGNICPQTNRPWRTEMMWLVSRGISVPGRPPKPRRAV